MKKEELNCCSSDEERRAAEYRCAVVAQRQGLALRPEEQRALAIQAAQEKQRGVPHDRLQRTRYSLHHNV